MYSDTMYFLMEAIFGGIILFLLTRMFWLWYFGMSEVHELLRSIDASLKCLPVVQEQEQRMKRINRAA